MALYPLPDWLALVTTVKPSLMYLPLRIVTTHSDNTF